MTSHEGWGRVFFCPTPLGNLRDITLRVLEILQQVDAIICEDTRVTLKLLTHYQIRKPLFSYRSQNRTYATRRIMELLKSGKNLAFVSDAGMPGIQDPGCDLIRVLQEEGLDFEVLPGPSSLLLGVLYAAFPDPGFTFLGFLPRKGGERKRLLKKSLSSPFSVVLYESPHRLRETLQDIREIVEDSRKVVLVRELTKFHEEIQRGTIGDMLLDISSRTIKGEIILIVEGKKEEEDVPFPLEKFVKVLEKRGLTRKEIVDILSEGLSVKKGFIKRSFGEE
ncbi:MAG: 16S rRNA (cytidine(1402)-2'-O)-methyltransferase [Atribacterota bacterium]|nr:16S rRNA (cytidine(1402)-2'-O)-methyltransferase [Atribacterota bacterium]